MEGLLEGWRVEYFIHNKNDEILKFEKIWSVRSPHEIKKGKNPVKV